MQKRHMILGIATVVVIVIIGVVWMLVAGVTAAKSEAVAFATRYLTEASNPWTVRAVLRNTTQGFKNRCLDEGMAQSAALCQQELGSFDSLELARFEIKQVVSATGETERIVMLDAYADFEKSRNRAVRFRLVKRDGVWLVDRFAVDVKSLNLPPPEF